MTTEELYAELTSLYGIRNGKKQKTVFLERIRQIFLAEGIPAAIQRRGGNRNLLLGKLDTAPAVVTAHYDTPRRNLLNVPMYYDTPIRKSLRYFPQSVFNAVCGVCRNPSNINDNTSGILGVFDILVRNRNLAGVLFDNEEKGVLGSEMFYRRMKQYRGKPYINLDCIGAGTDYVVMYNRGERELAERVASCAGGEFPIEVRKDTAASYYSDNKALDAAITVAAFKRDGKGRLYVNDIHTKHDTSLNMLNILFVTNMVTRYNELFLKASRI